jgi:hypothetical protein
MARFGRMRSCLCIIEHVLEKINCYRETAALMQYLALPRLKKPILMESIKRFLFSFMGGKNVCKAASYFSVEAIGLSPPVVLGIHLCGCCPYLYTLAGLCVDWVKLYNLHCSLAAVYPVVTFERDWLDGAIKTAKGPEYQYIRSLALLNKSVGPDVAWDYTLHAPSQLDALPTWGWEKARKDDKCTLYRLGR